MERRAKTIDISSYYPIPSDGEICSAVISNCSQPTSKVISSLKFYIHVLS